ncbi:MAG: M48 family metallopeptidase [Actinomycetota bacterium]
MKRRNFSAKALAIVLTLLLVPLELPAQYSEPVLPNPGNPGMSKQQQEQLGLQAAAQVYKQMPVLPDSSPVTQYVQRLGRKLERVIPPDHSWPYQFHVIPAADINAFALPGGQIFVNVATIQAAANEAQLAGVMAHEMSHVYMQHSAKQAPKQEIAQVIAGIAGAVLGGSTAGNLARLGIQFGAGTMLMKYSRADEAQADAVGAIIMYKAGYNPKAMADFFTTLQKKYGNGGPQFLSDHPNPGNREQAIDNEIKQWPSENYVNNSPQFSAAKKEAAATKTYTAQQIDTGAKQGVWARQNQQNGAAPPSAAAVPASSGAQGQADGSTPAPGGSNVTSVTYDQVKPSGSFTQYQQSGITISYPQNWQAGGDQNTAMIAPPAGAGNGGIAYGVVIGNQQGNSNLDQATQQLIQSMAQDNPGLQAAGSASSIDVNGVQGRSIYLNGNSPVLQNGKPVPERDWLVTLPNPRGGLTYLVFVAPQHDFSKLQPVFKKMLQSLRLS